MLWVGQFSMVAGQAREEGPWLGIFPHRLATEPSDFYVVVEPALPGSEEFCPQLVAALGRLFHERKLSLTGGLLRALKAAHEHLRDWNRKSLKEHRVAAGTSCLALRGREAYLAQVGPTAAYFCLNGQLQRVVPTLADAIEPLGLYEEFWPAFSRYHLAAGDRILLTSTNLAAAMAEETVARALSLAPQEALPQIYLQARALPDCAALLLAFLPEETPAEAP